MVVAGFQCNPASASHQGFTPLKCASQSCCRRRTHLTCCSENEPSGSGRSFEHIAGKPERRLSSKNTAAVLLSSFLWSSSSATALATQLAPEVAKYTPSPMEPGWEIYVGFAAGVIPFVIASYEFGKRILIQRRCPECLGKGLVQRGKVLRKCTQCGGMLPWLGWKMFLFSTVRDPGNGGPLNQPRGQKSIFYTVPPPLPRKTEESDNAVPASSKSENES